MRAAVVDHEQRRIRVATHRLDVAPLLGDATPRLGGEQVVAGLAADALRQVDELLCVGRLGARESGSRHHQPVPSAPRVARCGERAVRASLDRGGAAEEEVASRPSGRPPSRAAASSAAASSSQPPSRCTVEPSTCSRGAATASSTRTPPQSPPGDLGDRAREAHRAGAAEHESRARRPRAGASAPSCSAAARPVCRGPGRSRRARPACC